MGKLDGQVAIITGAGSGMGKAAAQLFAQEGARVVVAEIDTQRGVSVVEDIRRNGNDAIFVKTDVSNSKSVQAMVAATIDQYRSVNILYNNAAATTLCNNEDRAVTELPEEIWDAIQAITLKGVYLCSKFVIPEIVRAGGGVVVNTSSVDGLIGQPGIDAYTAAKGGVIALTRSMAVEFAPLGIRVNCICPGFVDTEVQEELMASPKSRAAIESMHLTRIGVPRDIANFALYLCSAEAEYITGSIFTIDGGFAAFKTRIDNYTELARS